MLERVPGSYLLIGNGIDKGDGDRVGACMVHNPGYDFNDHNVAIGSAYWVLLTERFLSAPRPAEAGRPPRESGKVAKPHFLESKP